MGLVSGWGAATRGGGGRNPAATTPPPWVRWKKKKRRGSCEMGLSRLFFAWESTELLGTPSQMHRHVDNNLISQLTTTRVGWRWVDSRGLELPSQIFQTNFIQTNFSNEFHQNENKCFVAFGVVGERRVGAERVKFNLGVHGCF
ncbi:unnamed protein product [Prunus armeniaca]